MKSRVKKIKYNIKDFIKNVYKVFRKPEMVILPGNIAFYICLAIIPILSLISYGASILNLSTSVIYDFISHSFSTSLADLILGVNLSDIGGIDFIITIIVGLYVASNGTDAIILASNTIYNTPNKSWIKRRIKALLMMFILIILVLFMLIVPVFGDNIITLIKEVNMNPLITNRIVLVFELLQGPITWIIMFLIIKALYSIARDKNKETRVVNYGAVFTTIMFIVGTKIYSIYVTNYASYTALYGGLANIIVLMIWIYFLSLIFTIGMSLNSEKDEINLLKNGKYDNK